MGLITQETAEEIWKWYREINAAKKLMVDMDAAAEEAANRGEENRRYAERLKDAFGRQQDLQLGVPSGPGAHRLYNVSPSLAKSVIRAHIENARAALAEANEKARIELETQPF